MAEITETMAAKQQTDRRLRDVESAVASLETRATATENKFGSYYTAEQMNSKLGSYYTAAQVNTKLGSYYTKSETYKKSEIDSKTTSSDNGMTGYFHVCDSGIEGCCKKINVSNGKITSTVNTDCWDNNSYG